MNYNSIMKVAVAAALLFGVNMEADAQFGKLKNLAKKAKDAVVDNSGTSNPVSKTVDAVADDNESTTQMTEASASSDPYANMSPRYKEIKMVEAAGGMDKYLGMTEGDEALVYKYYDKYGNKYNYDITGAHDEGKSVGHSVAVFLVNVFRVVKAGIKDVDLVDCKGADSFSIRQYFYPYTSRDVHGDYKEPARFDKMMKESVKDFTDSQTKKTNIKMPQADYDAFYRVAAKAKAAYEAKFGKIEPMP